MSLRYISVAFIYAVCFFLYFAYFPLFLPVPPEVVFLGQIISALIVVVAAFLVLDVRAYSYYFLSVLFVFLLVFVYLFTFLNPHSTHDGGKLLVLFLVFMLSAAGGVSLTFFSEKEKLIKVYAYFSMVLTLLIFIGQYHGEGGRLGQNTGGNPIWIARISGVFIVYSLIGTFYSKLKAHDLLLVLAALFVLISTGSRGPLLSVVLACLFFLMIKPGHGKKKVALLVSVALVTSGVIYFLPEEMLYRFIEGGTNGRDYLFFLAVQLIKENIWGWGAGGFSLQTAALSGLSYPHNLVLESLVEMGVVFSIVLIAFVFLSLISAASLVRAHAAEKVYGVLLGLLVYSLINSMFSGDMTSPKEMYLFSAFFVIESWRRLRGVNTPGGRVSVSNARADLA